MTFTKIIYHNKTSLDKIQKEIDIQNYIYNKYNICPKIISYHHYDDHTKIIMEKINGNTLADEYSEENEDIPETIWDSIRNIIRTLLYDEGIEYIDVTAYNFMLQNNKLFIIDFGHAYWGSPDGDIINWYLEEFIVNDKNFFNPDFR